VGDSDIRKLKESDKLCDHHDKMELGSSIWRVIQGSY
jgi:hypothetical protein